MMSSKEGQQSMRRERKSGGGEECTIPSSRSKMEKMKKELQRYSALETIEAARTM